MVTFVMKTGDVVLARSGSQVCLPLVVSFVFFEGTEKKHSAETEKIQD